MKKPRVFIASSNEGLDIAEAVNINLDRRNETKMWKNFFTLGSDTLNDLLDKYQDYDFAIFIFTPDDLIEIRGEKNHVARDNVVFELGLFFGTLGKKRCFLVKPRDEALHLPTDLLGLTFADYDANRSDGDLTSAVTAPCTLIQNQIQALGPLSINAEVRKEERRKISYNYKLGDVEHRLLAEILEDHAAFPDGVSVVGTFNTLSRQGRHKLGLAAAKLERMGYLSRKNVSDERRSFSNDEGEYYAFCITEDGIDYMLQNEHLVFGGSNSQVATGSTAEIPPDDDIPF